MSEPTSPYKKNISLRISTDTHLLMRQYNSLTSWSDLFEKAVNQAVTMHIREINEIKKLIICQPVLAEALNKGLIVINDQKSELVQEDERD